MLSILNNSTHRVKMFITDGGTKITIPPFSRKLLNLTVCEYERCFREVNDINIEMVLEPRKRKVQKEHVTLNAAKKDVKVDQIVNLVEREAVTAIESKLNVVMEEIQFLKSRILFIETMLKQPGGFFANSNMLNLLGVKTNNPSKLEMFKQIINDNIKIRKGVNK